MRFLIDVSAASRVIQDTLISWGHDVLSAVQIDPNLDDETLLAIANAERRIMITHDKDFGKLVFERGLPHRGVIRFQNLSSERKISAMNELINERSDALLNGDAIVVITPKRTRLRRSPAANSRPPDSNR